MGSTVETSYGKLQGFDESGVRVFRGIPYAQPPIGARRFRAPDRPLPWAGVRTAHDFGPAAQQNPNALGPLGFDIGPMDEDCLSLNVWTPGCDGARRPVLVWIHGGAFILGAGSQALYDGATLARRGDVVVVTINYRLGAFGFLDLSEAGVGDANLGMRDQIAALEWVRDEIAAFGGNPDNVTIFGESAGSISVAALLGTPRAQGLFHRAILQSGAANFAGSRAQAARVAAAFLKEMSLTSAESFKLREAPPAQLLEAQQRVYLAMQGQVRGLPFAPVVDGDLLPQHPFEAIRAGLVKDVPVLVGSNLDELKLFVVMDPEARWLDEAALLKRCEHNSSGADASGVSHGQRAIDTYRSARATRGAATTPPELWFAIESDRVFRYPAMRLAAAQRAHQPHTYAYLFSWPSPFMEGMLGACHALELPFVFGTFNDPMIGQFAGGGPAANGLAERIQDAWLAFARTGNPACPRVGEWPAYDATRRATMILDADSRVEHAPLEDERRSWEFWDAMA
jgi:para-nitrobenzyl esterase